MLDIIIDCEFLAVSHSCPTVYVCTLYSCTAAYKLFETFLSKSTFFVRVCHVISCLMSSARVWVFRACVSQSSFFLYVDDSNNKKNITALLCVFKNGHFPSNLSHCAHRKRRRTTH